MEQQLPVANTEESCVIVDGEGIRLLTGGYDPPPDPASCHAIRFQVDERLKEMIMEYRRRLAAVERALSGLTENTTAAAARLDKQNNTFSTWDD